MNVALLVSDDLAHATDLACAWAGAGDQVWMVLLDGAVAAARTGHAGAALLRRAEAAGVAVGADEQALQRRGLDQARVGELVKMVTIDELADLVVSMDKVVWL